MKLYEQTNNNSKNPNKMNLEINNFLYFSNN